MDINSECFVHFFKKPATRLYPKEKVKPEERSRGKIKFTSKNCTGCRMCFLVCPANAITFRSKGDLDFDMSKCIFCGSCVDACRFNALHFCTEFEYSSKRLKDMVINKDRP
ncbi:MAG: 4Fe-4S dicluster domain-containing protein [Candidatus Woesearchaeota archaeon]